MKIQNLIGVLILILLLFNNYATRSGASSLNNNELKDLPISNLKIKDKNIHLTLFELAKMYNIPIGLVVSSEDDLINGVKLNIEVAQGTLEDVLDSIIAQNSLYSWKIIDNAVNVFPKENNEDSLLKKLLELEIENFSTKKGINRFTLREEIVKIPEINKLLRENSVLAQNEVFTSYDTSSLGREFSLNVSSIKFRDLLNNIIKQSNSKYWIINRYGETKQYLLLNF